MSPSLITDESHEACPVPSQSHIRRMEKTYGLRIEAAFHPFGLIGGDFWGIVPIDRHRFGLFIVDICGHGPAALPHAWMFRRLMDSEAAYFHAPGRFMSRLNGLLYSRFEAGMFASALYGVCDIREDVMTYATAIAMPPIYRAGSHHPFRAVMVEGLPLGFQENTDYDLHQLEFEPGGELILYTDALIETPDPPYNFHDPQKLAQSLNTQSPDAGPRARLVAIMAPLADHLINDDLSVIALWRL